VVRAVQGGRQENGLLRHQVPVSRVRGRGGGRKSRPCPRRSPPPAPGPYLLLLFQLPRDDHVVRIVRPCQVAKATIAWISRSGRGGTPVAGTASRFSRSKTGRLPFRSNTLMSTSRAPPRRGAPHPAPVGQRTAPRRPSPSPSRFPPGTTPGGRGRSAH
jgi:hypothetical protein